MHASRLAIWPSAVLACALACVVPQPAIAGPFEKAAQDLLSLMRKTGFTAQQARQCGVPESQLAGFAHQYGAYLEAASIEEKISAKTAALLPRLAQRLSPAEYAAYLHKRDEMSKAPTVVQLQAAMQDGVDKGAMHPLTSASECSALGARVGELNKNADAMAAKLEAEFPRGRQQLKRLNGL